MAAAQPFPPLLKWTLLSSIAMIAVQALIGLSKPSDPTAVIVLLAVALVMQLIAVPIATWLLLRGGYVSPANIAMTVIAAVPLGLAVYALLSISFGWTRFHIWIHRPPFAQMP